VENSDQDLLSGKPEVITSLVNSAYQMERWVTFEFNDELLTSRICSWNK